MVSECGAIRASAADLKFLHRQRQPQSGTSNRKSGTRIIALLVPFTSEVRVKACCDVPRTSEAGTSTGSIAPQARSAQQRRPRRVGCEARRRNALFVTAG